MDSWINKSNIFLENKDFKEGLKFISSNEEILIQSEDMNKFNSKNFKVVSKKKPR